MAAENYLYTRDSVMSIRVYHSLQIVHKTMSDKITFAMAINTAQGKTLKRLEIAWPPPPSPNHLYMAFSRSSSLDNFAFAIIDSE
jgi:hypothetical protein